MTLFWMHISFIHRITYSLFFYCSIEGENEKITISVLSADMVIFLYFLERIMVRTLNIFQIMLILFLCLDIMKISFLDN